LNGDSKLDKDGGLPPEMEIELAAFPGLRFAEPKKKILSLQKGPPQVARWDSNAAETDLAFQNLAQNPAGIQLVSCVKN